MSASDDVADSTDWLPTPLAALAPIEALLRCQVCKDFYNTPMTTSCLHTFCSLCIRRYLAQEGKCPTCREPDQEMKLRRSGIVEELVENFKPRRDEMLRFARSAGQSGDERPLKRRRIAAAVPQTARRSTRSHSRLAASQEVSVPPPEIEIQSSDDDSEYDAEADTEGAKSSPDGSVECPICCRKVKESAINAHIDNGCAGGEVPQTPQKLKSTRAEQQRSNRAVTPQARLATLNYSILNDNALRRKLKDLGIPNLGSKEIMRRRHTEWVNLWNANCDARNPVSKHDLIRELNKWERSLGRQPDRGPAGVMVKEFDRDAWQQSNKGNFDDLIRQAREKKKASGAVTLTRLKAQPSETNGISESENQVDPYSDQTGVQSNPGPIAAEPHFTQSPHFKDARQRDTAFGEFGELANNTARNDGIVSGQIPSEIQPKIRNSDAVDSNGRTIDSDDPIR